MSSESFFQEDSIKKRHRDFVWLFSGPTFQERRARVLCFEFMILGVGSGWIIPLCLSLCGFCVFLCPLRGFACSFCLLNLFDSWLCTNILVPRCLPSESLWLLFVSTTLQFLWSVHPS